MRRVFLKFLEPLSLREGEQVSVVIRRGRLLELAARLRREARNREMSLSRRLVDVRRLRASLSSSPIRRVVFRRMYTTFSPLP